jgi:hypothetical protein
VRVLFWVRILLNEGFPSDNVEEIVLTLIKLVVNIRGRRCILLATSEGYWNLSTGMD